MSHNMLTKVAVDFGYKFWKSLIITTHEFENYADTFDIILFKSDAFAPRFQRFLGDSEFNHAGIVLRSESNILILEANSQDGVIIYDWKRLKGQGLKRAY